jgi:hypothetical protein
MMVHLLNSINCREAKCGFGRTSSPELTYLLPAVLVLTTATRRTIENDMTNRNYLLNANCQQRYRMLHWEFMFTADAAAADWIIGNPK